MTGEPLSHARQKCPELVVVPPDHELYAASSRKFIEILEEVAPVIEQCSIDEAFCDMTGTEKLYGDPIAFATKLKMRECIQIPPGIIMVCAKRVLHYVRVSSFTLHQL